MARLPNIDGDYDQWGIILNAFLSVSLASDGTLNSGVVSNTNLDSSTQSILASVASKYVMPPSGLPLSLLPTGIPLSNLSTTGTASSSTYLRGDGAWSTPAAGVILDSTASDIQPDTTTGTAIAGSTNKAADAGHQHPLVAHDHSTTNKGGQITPTTGLATTGTASSTTYLRGDNTWSTVAGASNATTSTPGLIQLSGSLGGTATAPTVLTNANLSGDVTSVGNTTTLTNSSNVQSVVNNLIATNTNVTNKLTTATAASTYAPLASPTLTGTPLAPTATAGTNTTQIATTAFVESAIPANLPPSGTAGGDLTGTYPNPTLTNSSNVESIITANTTVAGALQQTGAARCPVL